ncbi:MAG: hypothetical protein AAFZ18_12640, partial [Myxococcota bacterium]
MTELAMRLKAGSRAQEVGRKEKKAPPSQITKAGRKEPGDVLLSHRVSPAVPSALWSLTTE